MIKTALITGGSKGIGRKTAESLAAAGCRVVINYRSDREQAEQFASELSATFGVVAAAVGGDVSSKEDCEHIASFVLREFGGADIVVHNAGPYIHERKTMAEYSWDEWTMLMNGNMTAVFYLTKLLLPSMKENGWGRIITFGFDRVDTAPGWIDRSAYAAAKTGLASLTKTIAAEEAASGVTANMVCPGDITGSWKEKKMIDALGVHSTHVPVGRPGTGEDIARVVAFLVSEESSFITGAIIPVTGGQDVLGKHFRK
ncbi:MULTISPECIES: SDR family oxidoreductase [Bacillaceae]|uniref:3-ketoacyl-ACP reductase n=1 Tax=Domibacillus aminovorans TaxID=29332 RepID=A0A177KS61_9BACI|nr:MULTISPECIES: SDR family oxidoreductase [Bacillaceae]OAH55795.1 3-ketoacyl-ACP reductase [Domibacillus aminovorans]OAH60933.1 3-ketoacyl-ACP reductase [Domibacillus aminovorans]